MAKTLIVKPLGLVLQKAGLVSPEQVKIALEDQKKHLKLKIGEILAIKGWIDPKTADFFAEKWSQILTRPLEQPLGQYLKQAGLLDESQIAMILQEQGNLGLKFGAIAVVKGLISQQTLDFFLEQLELTKIRDKMPQSILLDTPEICQIENYLLHNVHCQPIVLLKLYQQIWQQKEIPLTNSKAERELLNSGLVIREGGVLKLGRSPHLSFFDDNWLQQQLAKLQPYSKIRLKLFGLETKASFPYKILTEVDYWSNGQPFLTQKIYQVIQEHAFFIPRGKEAEIIEALIQKYIIDNWERGTAAQHLCQLRDSWLKYDQCSPTSLLKTYKKIWQERENVSNGSPEPTHLLNIGLLQQKDGKLKIANPIYQNVFNHNWIDRQLAHLNQSITVSPTNNNHQHLTPSLLSSPATDSNHYKVFLTTIIVLFLGGLLGLGFNLLVKYRQIKQFNQANQLWQQQDYQQALKIYHRLLRSDQSNNYRLWMNRGYALAGLKQYDQMLQSCTSATLINPNASLAWNCQGEAHYYLGNYQSAAQAFEQATKINPQQPVFWLNYTESLLKLQQYSSAYLSSQKSMKLLQQSTTDNSENIKNLSFAYYQQGQALLKRDKYHAALSAFERSLVLNPNYLTAQQGKGIALYELGEYESASEVFHKILQQDNLSEARKTTIRLYQGVNFCGADNVAAAHKIFQQVLKSSSSAQVRAIAKTGCGIK